MLGEHRTFWSFCVGVMMLGCASCAPVGKVEPTAGAPQADKTYFVLGVQPFNAQVSLFRGDINRSKGRFDQNIWVGATFQGTAEDGFVVGESKGETTLAITMVSLKSSPTAIFGTNYFACNGANALVFTAPAGKVVYVGNARYDFTGTGLVPHYSMDFEAARVFMAKHYPQLVDRLEQGRYEILPTGPGSC
jgi:hypothetical protein